MRKSLLAVIALVVSTNLGAAQIFYDSEIDFFNDLNALSTTATLDALDGAIASGNIITRQDFTISFEAGFEGVADDYFGTNQDGVGVGSNGGTSGGIAFTFSDSINAFGMTIDGWGNCCGEKPFNLLMNTGEELFTIVHSTEIDRGSAPAVFIGVIDFSNTFTNIHIYGDSSGDSIVGGLVNYATINPVPIPAAIWLFGSGLIGLIGMARRKA